jgi:prepilin-type N-terminal cleavage/methylation domain-containing protein
MNPGKKTSAAAATPAVTTGTAGFTLLEVLIALVVLAVGAAATMSAISGSLGNIRKAQLRTRVMEYAENAMEGLLYKADIQQPATYAENLEDGFRYVVTVEDFDPGLRPVTGTQSATGLQFKLLRYTVEMYEPDSTAPVYELQTLKLVSTSEEGQSPTTP